MIRTITIASLLALPLFAQDNPRGEFYLKDEVKGFVSLHGELRGLTDNAIGDINGTAFKGPWGYSVLNADGDTVRSNDKARLYEYKQFGDRIIGLGFEVGAQYHQLSTWIDVYFNPTQESPVPKSLRNDTPELQTVKWFQYGFDWMWGYMLAPEKSTINLIPSVGFGFSLLNMQFASNYDLYYTGAPDEEMQTYTMGNQYYSTFGKDAVGQVELRLNLGNGLSLGGFGGMRMTWYDRMFVENGEMDYFVSDELVGHTWYVGGKVTYTMSSRAEDKAREKL